MSEPISQDRIALIACEVFRTEIEAIFRKTPTPRVVRWLEMSQHDRPDLLNRSLQQAIEEIEADPQIEVILLAYGLCGNAALGLRTSRAKLVIPKAHDCIGILLGGEGAHGAARAAHPRCYWYSPGWIRGGKTPGPEYFQAMRERYARTHDPEEVEELMEATFSQYELYDEALYLDTGADSKETDLAHLQASAEMLGWKASSHPAQLDMLKNLFSQVWREEHFLVVPPQESIGLATAGQPGVMRLSSSSEKSV